MQLPCQHCLLPRLTYHGLLLQYAYSHGAPFPPPAVFPCDSARTWHTDSTSPISERGAFCAGRPRWPGIPSTPVSKEDDDVE